MLGLNASWFAVESPCCWAALFAHMDIVMLGHPLPLDM